MNENDPQHKTIKEAQKDEVKRLVKKTEDERASKGKQPKR